MNKAQPVDLTNLREVTDGNPDLEKSLFGNFFQCAEENIQELSHNCIDGASTAWTEQAHALKGAALNMGAFNLGEICDRAQNMHEATANDRAVTYTQIKNEYEAVKAYLEKVHP